MKPTTLLLFLFLMGSMLFAQQKDYVNGIFRGSRVINSHSLETQDPGVFEFIISHRFGILDGGINTLFGLDNATMRIGFAYGVNRWLTLGVGRSTFQKTYDGYAKVRILRQVNGGNPVSLTYLGSVAVRSEQFGPQDSVEASQFSNRLFYTHQLIIGSKISDRLSVQLMPTLVHRNFIDEKENETNDVFAVGAAARYRLTKKFAIVGEYYYVLPGQLRDEFVNSAALGIEITTNGHSFQLELTNSQGMIEKIFITETFDRIDELGIRFGFNIGRKFKARGKWY
ncbi:MAG: DUF5777 family beta-barrel protein [Bacteroidia bacterium]|nr:DUF5777 family beta-barrel protein [Bacteroidia bacterium]